MMVDNRCSCATTTPMSSMSSPAPLPVLSLTCRRCACRRLSFLIVACHRSSLLFTMTSLSMSAIPYRRLSLLVIACHCLS